MAVLLSEAIPYGELRYARTPKWVRAEAGGTAIADSRRALLVYKPGPPVPLYAFPDSDVSAGALVAAPDDGEDRGGPVAETFALAGAEDGAIVAWRYEDPDLRDVITFAWGAADRWLEEEEQIFGHARDPYHRVDARESTRHVVVQANGTVLADSHRPHIVFETTLPVRFYLPREDVRMDLLEPTDKRTWCAYKGQASYFSAPDAPNIAWTYPEPLVDAPPIRDLVCFFNEFVELTIDDERWEQPDTQWSRERAGA
jgi:uncharacterized protein (DUF427 family)